MADLVDGMNQCESFPVPLESDDCAPPGFSIDKVSAPPDFEGPAPLTISPVRKVKATTGLNGNTVRRVTRSQVKKGMKQAIRSHNNLGRPASKEKCAEESPLGRDSVATTESMIKLA